MSHLHSLRRPFALLFLVGLVVLSGRAEPLRVVEDADTISVRRGDDLVLAYRKTAVPLPEGVDPVFARNGLDALEKG